jgi:hypothetical protein
MFENQSVTMNATAYSGRPAHHVRHRGDDDDDDYFSHSKYYPRQGNSSITASVTIHVTPEHYHLLNWALLWTGFILAITVASYQVHQENKWFAARKREEHEGATEGEGTVSSADWTRNRVSIDPLGWYVIASRTLSSTSVTRWPSFDDCCWLH